MKNHLGALIAWIVILLIAIFALPNVNALTRAHSTVSLPSDVESNVAKTLQNEWGSKKKNTYEVAIVFNKKNGKLTQVDKDNIQASIDRLTNNKKKYGIKDYLAPEQNIATRKQLESKDGTTWIMQTNIAKSHDTISNVYKQINNAVKTDGIRTYVTGADILNDDFSSSIQEGIKKTEVITVIFIFIVLIIVFKSPVVPLVSLLTVGVSFLVSFSIVTNLVNAVNFPFSNFTQVFMVIVLFGIGTDYNILLYNTFKDNLGRGLSTREAAEQALRKAGRTILYSGSSILIGFFALGLANFSVYRSAVGVAVGVLVLLVVLLTLNPFFMFTLGPNMFWPVKKFEGEKPSKLWHGISSATLKRPIIFLVVVAVVAAPFFIAYSNVLNYDDTAEVSDSTPSKQGFLTVQKHFSKGMAEPSYLYIKSKHRLDNEKDLKLLDQLTLQLRESKGVDKVMSVTEPYNEKIKALYVKRQLKTVTDGTKQLENGVTRLTKGSEKVTSGANQLSNGADALTNGIGTLGSGAEQLYSGTVRLHNGSVSLANGAGTLANGAGTLASGSQTLATGANTLYSGTVRLSNGANSLASGAGTLASGTGRLQSGANTLKNGTSSLATGANSLYSGTKQLTNGASQLTTNMKTLVNGLDQLKSTLSSETGSMNTNQLSQLSAGLTQLNNGLQQLNNSVSAISVPNVDTSSLSQLSSELNSLKSQLSGLSSLASTLNTAKNSVGAISQDAQALQTAVSQLSTDDQKKIAPALTKLSGDLSSLSKLSDISVPDTSSLQSIQNVSIPDLSSLESMPNQIKTLQSSVAQLAQGSNTLNTQAQNGISQMSSGLSQLSTLQSAIDRLDSGAHQLYTGSNSLYSGLSTGMAGALRLANGANRLNSGAASLSAGIGQVNSGASRLSSGANTLATGLQSGVSGAGRLANGADQLTNGANRLSSGATTLSNGANTLSSGLASGESGAQQLADGTQTLQSGSQRLGKGASKLANSTPQITTGLTTVNNGLVSAGSYLNGLRKSKASDTFYIPTYVLKNNDQIKESIKTYLSPDKKTAMIMIIFNTNPSSSSAAARSQALSAMARKSLQGTDLGKAQVAMGGQSSTIQDTKTTAGNDFTRTAAIMLIGIGLALIFVTRSLLQPIYILGTLLIAYFASLTINRWIVSGILHRGVPAWNMPFFTFIMIIALGVDYSIFVMMHYRDDDSGALPSERILNACSVIGTVVLSAMIILGGTFAALIPSGVPTLIEVALGVDVGLIILAFLMPITLSATTKLTYEGFTLFKKRPRKSKSSDDKKIINL